MGNPKTQKPETGIQKPESEIRNPQIKENKFIKYPKITLHGFCL